MPALIGMPLLEREEPAPVGSRESENGSVRLGQREIECLVSAASVSPEYLVVSPGDGFEDLADLGRDVDGQHARLDLDLDVGPMRVDSIRHPAVVAESRLGGRPVYHHPHGRGPGDTRVPRHGLFHLARWPVGLAA